MRGEELAADIARRHGAPVEMMHLRTGIFDEASVLLITSETVRAVASGAGRALDARRFRPNIVVRLLDPNPFQEDNWVGSVLLFGEADEGPRVSITMRDLRCSMVNLDPESACSTPEVLKSIARMNQSHAGIYGTVLRVGRLATGQTVRLQASGGRV